MSKPFIYLSAEPESSSPERDEKTQGYVEGFAKSVRAMQRKHSRLWGWCMVTVTVEHADRQAHAYLGGCCYESASDFRDSSGYYPQMVSEAASELLEQGGWSPEQQVELEGFIAEYRDICRAEYAAQRAAAEQQPGGANV